MTDDKQITAAAQPLPAQAPDALAMLLSDVQRLQEVPVETVERLFAMHQEMQRDRARREFITAKHLVEAQCEPVRKTARNTQTGSLYATAEAVDDALSPLLAEHGFDVESWAEPCDIPDHLTVVLRLSHVGGHSERYTMPAPIDDRGPKGQPTKTRLHGSASSLNYVTRHLKCSVFNIQLTKDDDGNRGAGYQRITETQAADLEALLTEVKADRAKFYGFFKIKELSELPASAHANAVRMLEAKRK